jgi:CTP:molybdopterin cytidylyltransferase MocA
VVPRYADQPGPRNPVLLLRPAWSAAASLEGDRGLAELIEANPHQVAEVDGAMPDVDTTADLDALEG